MKRMRSKSVQEETAEHKIASLVNENDSVCFKNSSSQHNTKKKNTNATIFHERHGNKKRENISSHIATILCIEKISAVRPSV